MTGPLILPPDEFNALRSAAATLGLLPVAAERSRVAPEPDTEAMRSGEGDWAEAAGEIPPRIREDNAKARTLITSALLGELSRRLLEYENAIEWNTTCLSCSAVLDSSIAETFRREQAEGNLAEIEALCGPIVAAVPEPALATVAVSRILAIIGSEEESRGH